MSDDLGTLLRERSDRVRVPSSDLGEVVRAGKSRRRMRTAAGGFTVIALVAILLLALQAIPGRDQRRSLPTVDEPPISTDRRLLVIPAPEGAPPLEEGESAIADARAVTFAFHALVLNLEPYELDYKDFTRIDGGWEVIFQDGLSIDDLEELVVSRQGFISEYEGQVDNERDRLIRLEDELQQAVVEENLSEVNRLRDRVRESTLNLRTLIQELADTEAELREHISGLRELIESGEPPPIVLEVRVTDERLYVEAHTGELGSGKAERVLAHSERIDDVDVHGVDFHSVRLRSNPDDGMTFKANGFWTGPIPSTYQEECLLELRSGAGELLWRQPDVHDVYDDAPPSEDRRDGWARGGLGIGKRIGVPADEIVPSFKCSPKPR